MVDGGEGIGKEPTSAARGGHNRIKTVEQKTARNRINRILRFSSSFSSVCF